VFESSPPPGAPGAPAHVHHSYDEAWFVIEGTVEFVLGDRRERLEAGVSRSRREASCTVSPTLARQKPGCW
jgi:uncharacterized cupin superfamily protein